MILLARPFSVLAAGARRVRHDDDLIWLVGLLGFLLLAGVVAVVFAKPLSLVAPGVFNLLFVPVMLRRLYLRRGMRRPQRAERLRTLPDEALKVLEAIVESERPLLSMSFPYCLDWEEWDEYPDFPECMRLVDLLVEAGYVESPARKSVYQSPRYVPAAGAREALHQERDRREHERFRVRPGRRTRRSPLAA